MQIERWDEVRDGLLNEQSMRRKLEARGFRVMRYIYPAGTFFPEHEHGTDKIDAVLAGRFRMVLQGREVVLEAGDCVSVPKGVIHSAEVVGNEPVISLDALRIASC
jgi:mannose-6-phosphate isomerase-like protein (cupin superfamily)